jgi:hypothetical protein
MYPFQRTIPHHHSPNIVNNLFVHVDYEPYERDYDICGNCHRRHRSRSPRSRSRSRSPRR